MRSSPAKLFTIRVKSSTSEVPVDNKIDYLLRLELPFFIGVVRQSPPAMSIYSAELLPLLFSEWADQTDCLWSSRPFGFRSRQLLQPCR